MKDVEFSPALGIGVSSQTDQFLAFQDHQSILEMLLMSSAYLLIYPRRLLNDDTASVHSRPLLTLPFEQFHHEVSDLSNVSTVVIQPDFHTLHTGDEEAWECFMPNLSDSIPTAL